MLSSVNQERIATWKEVSVLRKQVVASERAVEFKRCEMEKFIQLGEKFGLEGEKLLEFVCEQQELEREKRQKEKCR